MKANIRTGLSLMNALKTLALLRNVVTKLTGNTHFPDPPVKLSDLTARGNALQAAIELATNGSQQSKLDRNKLTTYAKAELTSTADYVRSVGNGDAAILSTSGFELAKQREPIGIPGTSKRMEARLTGLRNELELRWATVHGAHGYQIWMTDKDPAVDGNWEAVGYTTRVRHLVTALDSYKAYWFCVSAIGVAGEGAQCDPAMGRAA